MTHLLTLTAYARRRGASYTSVRAKIYSGTISAALRYSATGKLLGINGDQADALWSAHTDPSRRGRARGGQDDDSDFQRARAVRARVTAELAQIALEEKLGSLVDAVQFAKESAAVL